MAAPLVDVCIVGYGPVGATLASLLAQAGISVAIVEREAALYSLPRAVHFDDEVMRVFQAIGIAEQILPFTHVSPGMRFVDGDGRLLLDWSRPAEVGPQGWNASYRFHQPDLERILRAVIAAQPNVAVLLDTVVVSILSDRDGCVVEHVQRSTAAPGQIKARYVVGCDGARSMVREIIGSPLDDLGFHERWVVVDAILRRPMPELGDYSLQHCSPKRPITYVRGVGDRRRWELALRPGEDAADMTRPDLVYRLLSRWITPEDAYLERAVCYEFSSVVAETWRKGRVMIAGDSAHQTPPFLGQGMCAGIRDVANLAWKLAKVCKGKAPDTLLDTYQIERAPNVREFIALTVRLGGLINTTNPAAALGSHDASGPPARMQSIRPALGPGLAAGSTRLSHTLAPQPLLGNGERLDDRTGYRFALLMQPKFAQSLPADLLQTCEGDDIELVIDDAPGVEDCLQQFDAPAIMIRPDRYVLGTASTLPELTNLVAVAGPDHR